MGFHERSKVTFNRMYNFIVSTFISTLLVFGKVNSETQTFSCTRGIQTFTVPLWVTSVDVDVVGAAGGWGGNALNFPGNGARVQTTLSVTPGEVLYVSVGEQGGGTLPERVDTNYEVPGGYGGGGDGHGGGSGGGGASDIRRGGGTELHKRMVVAGGGGGILLHGVCGTGKRGGDGGRTGATASMPSACGNNGGTPGTGGTQSAGGVGGTLGVCNLGAPTAGTKGLGGNACKNDAGGGGGGYWGGGGGSEGGGGGGGSSYSVSAESTVTDGYNTGNGSVVIHYAEEIFNSQLFLYTGAPQSFIVPGWVYSLNIDLMGAAGGFTMEDTNHLPGMGARVVTTLPVTPGETLIVYIGGQGANSAAIYENSGRLSAGGFNGGGNGADSGTGGGGASDIRRGGDALNDRVVVAGGGGGVYLGTVCGIQQGGHGGQNGTAGSACLNVGDITLRGHGGTSSGGGTGGSAALGTCMGLPAVAGAKGNGGAACFDDAGGGGGGYFGGGGGGTGSGGGGGSSYSMAEGAVFTTGIGAGNGSLIISYTGPSSPTSRPSSRPSGQPTMLPSGPSTQPSSTPTVQPSAKPSRQPSTQPVPAPSIFPTAQPLSSPSAIPTTMPSCPFGICTTTETFDFINASEIWTVPPDVTSITIQAFGAQGGRAPGGVAVGGLGGCVTATVNVVPGTTCYVYVGGQGGAGAGTGTSGAGGFNGGGAGYGFAEGGFSGGGGGGATEIRCGQDLFENILVIAGGGGGNRPANCGSGGVGGGLNGGPGTAFCGGGTVGGGGTQTEGGGSAERLGAAPRGGLHYGGPGNSITSQGGGGGGGGGYYGGGGGDYAGGGGGSGYAVPSATAVSYVGTRSGHGQLIITYTASEPSAQPTMPPTITPTTVPSQAPSLVPTVTPTLKPSVTPTIISTCIPTPFPSKTPSRPPTFTPTASPSVCPSAVPTSNRPSSQPSSGPTVQPSGQPSNCPSVRPSRAPSSQPSSQPTSQPSCLPSSQPGSQPTSQPSCLPSSQPGSQPTSQPSCLPSNQPSAQPSGDPTSQPFDLPSSQPSGDPTSQPSDIPSSQPSVQPSMGPSSQPSRKPTQIPTAQPSHCPSGMPTCDPTSQPSNQPVVSPTIQPSSLPSGLPSTQPSGQPTNLPTVFPNGSPSNTPSGQPTGQPSAMPSTNPSLSPSARPTSQPSSPPSSRPSAQPIGMPSSDPTAQPSSQPTGNPTAVPSRQPSTMPTMAPSMRPSSQPSACPSVAPSSQPSVVPPMQPWVGPTSQPSALPSVFPSNQPSVCPTASPTNLPQSSPTSLPSAQPSGLPSSQPSRQPSSHPSIYLSKGTLPKHGSGLSANGMMDRGARVVLPFLFTSYVSGDGFHDVVAGPLTNYSSYVLYGSKAHPSDISLTLSEGNLVSQTTRLLSYDFSSRSVAHAGDINGDGYDDLIIGVPYAARVYVLFGSRIGFVNMTEGFTVYGAKSSDLTGWSVSGAGDVNNDTLADIVVGAPMCNSGAGAAFVLYGKLRGVADMNLNDLESGDGYALNGHSAGLNVGVLVASAGDVNGDGYDDVIVGALNSNAFYAGAAIVLFGADSSELTSLNSIALMLTRGVIIMREKFSWFGYSVSGAGDANNDTFADIIVGSIPYRNNVRTEVAYMMYGGKNVTSSSLLANQTVVSGGGVYVSGVGDLDRDGFDDVLIGTGYDLSTGGGFYVRLPRNDSARTVVPTVPPTVKPSVTPSVCPSHAPSVRPTQPTVLPTAAPSGPTLNPTIAPTQPTSLPSAAPTVPTVMPSKLPTVRPTATPTVNPTLRPPTAPSCNPTVKPTVQNTQTPSIVSTVQLSPKPVINTPTRRPLLRPTAAPTVRSQEVLISGNFTEFVRNSSEHVYGIVNTLERAYVYGTQGSLYITVMPTVNVNLYIEWFNVTNDVIDLSHFKSLHSVGDLQFSSKIVGRRLVGVNSSYDVSIGLGANQTVIIGTIVSGNAADIQFKFATKLDNEDGTDKKKNDTNSDNWTSPAFIVAVVFGSTVLLLMCQTGFTLCRDMLNNNHSASLVKPLSLEEVRRGNRTFITYIHDDSWDDLMISSDSSSSSSSSGNSGNGSRSSGIDNNDNINNEITNKSSDINMDTMSGESAIPSPDMSESKSSAPDENEATTIIWEQQREKFTEPYNCSSQDATNGNNCAYYLGPEALLLLNGGLNRVFVDCGCTGSRGEDAVELNNVYHQSQQQQDHQEQQEQQRRMMDFRSTVGYNLDVLYDAEPQEGSTTKVVNNSSSSSNSINKACDYDGDRNDDYDEDGICSEQLSEFTIESDDHGWDHEECGRGGC